MDFYYYLFKFVKIRVIRGPIRIIREIRGHFLIASRTCGTRYELSRLNLYIILIKRQWNVDIFPELFVVKKNICLNNWESLPRINYISQTVRGEKYSTILPISIQKSVY